MWPFTAAYPLWQLEEVSTQEYDYIVVGGGTAGSVVASRLSEDPSATVLLVERGSFENSIQSLVPLVSTANGTYAVRQETPPEPVAEDRRVEILRGETLGGSSRMNGMIYMRGAPAFYNQWASQGSEDWCWSKVKPYFNKVEETVSLRQTSELVSSIHPYLRRSAEALGLPFGGSLSTAGAPAMGYYPFDLTIDRRGYRHSAWHAYLPKRIATERRSRLHICCDVTASRLHIDAACGVVHGVFIEPSEAKRAAEGGGKTQPPFLIKCKREVILASGAIRTPQILQLSGIGPRQLLESHHVPVVRDLPGVGSYLQDHSLLPVFVSVPSHDTLQSLQDSMLSIIKHVFLYATVGKGWLKSGVDRAAFINTSHFDEKTGVLHATEATLDPQNGENLPDAELMIVPIGTLPHEHPGKSLFTIQTCLVQTKSTGSVAINSSDPHAVPEPRLNMLTDLRDRVVARKALRCALSLAENFVFESGYPHEARVFAGPSKQTDGAEWSQGDFLSVSDESLDDYVRKKIASSYHLTSSCRMAPEDQHGVVDDRLRVHGFRNLRIADASALPCVPPAHTMGPTYMIAERCADFVKKAGFCIS